MPLSTKPLIYCGNSSAVLLSHNPVLHNRTKHMELDIHFVRDKVIQGALDVVHIPSKAQTADVLTKPLSYPSFSRHRSKLMVFDVNHPQFKGG